MTTEKKLETLWNAANKAWDDAFGGWEWDELTPKHFLMGENEEENGFAFFLGVSDNADSGMLWIEYEPEADRVKVVIKNRPIHAKYKEDLKALFEKYAPFDMKVSYVKSTTPVLSRTEKVKPKEMLRFFKAFRKAYQEHYPLFYMFTVSAKEWNDGFYITSSDC